MHPDTEERNGEGPNEALAWLDDLLTVQDLEECSCLSSTSGHHRTKVLFCINCRHTLCEAKKSEHRHGQLLFLRKIFGCVAVSSQDIRKLINVRNVQVGCDRDTIYLNRQTPSSQEQCVDCSLLSDKFFCSIYCKKKQASLEPAAEPEVEPEGEPEGERDPEKPPGKRSRRRRRPGKWPSARLEGQTKSDYHHKAESSASSCEWHRRSHQGNAEDEWFSYRPGCPYPVVDLDAKTAALEGKKVLSTDSLETVYIKTGR